MALFGFGTSAPPNFVPDADARGWVIDGLASLAPRLGGPARMPHVLGEAHALLGRPVHDLDSLFDMLCAVQEVIGQREVELTLVELDQGRPAPLPQEGLIHLGDPQGKLLHPLRHGEEYVMVFTSALFRAKELMLASVARALGHVALDRAGIVPEPERIAEWDADAELAAVLLGMGVWVANGSYMFENACCGGGCGVDLKSLRSGLSMPEACWALALDARRKGLPRRSVAKHLAATQRAALDQSWKSELAIPDQLALA